MNLSKNKDYLALLEMAHQNGKNKHYLAIIEMARQKNAVRNSEKYIIYEVSKRHVDIQKLSKGLGLSTNEILKIIYEMKQWEAEN